MNLDFSGSKSFTSSACQMRAHLRELAERDRRVICQNNEHATFFCTRVHKLIFAFIEFYTDLRWSPGFENVVLLVGVVMRGQLGLVHRRHAARARGRDGREVVVRVVVVVEVIALHLRLQLLDRVLQCKKLLEQLRVLLGEISLGKY